MADNEQAEGAAEGADAAPPNKGKLKLIIAAAGFSSSSAAARAGSS